MKGFLSMPKRKQYVFGVGVRVPGQLGAIEGRLWIGRAHRQLGARSHGRLPARRQPGTPPGRDTGASFRAEPYCFPLRPVPVLAPTHSSCFLICIFFCMDMPSSDKQGFLFFGASLVRLFSFRSCVRPLGSGVSLLCPLSPKMKGVTEACREM